ncbi:Ig-like domain-containing protein [Rhodopseudomonas palustris]|uniref:Ig-like domain-containing protein n=1 Tax=Rhodopseudomonas palustris TaxID=1076 RepID=UPI002ACECFF8|nr:Ig-like domain-containing protein [Rhodopseudomonas palustris]WQH01820.1 Ig-like domain-containing protein [Rhodopseudomonas palustris]
MRLLYLRGLALAALLLSAGLTGTASAQVEVITESTTVALSAAADKAVQGRVTLTAAITTRYGAGAADGRITFLDMTTMRVLGWTSVAQPRLTVDGLAPGRHLLRADYSGSAGRLPVIVLPSQSDELALDVLARPMVTLSSSAGVTAPGELVTFTVTVTGSAGTPGGLVTLRDGDSVMAAHVPLDRVGTAAFTTSALPDGVRAVTVDYQGDARYAAAEAQIDHRVTATIASAEPRM